MIKLSNEWHFKLFSKGKAGIIDCKNQSCQINIDYEMSGSSEYDILIAPLDINYWHKPPNIKISSETQLELLSELRNWLSLQKIKSNIDLPNMIEFEKIKCAFGQCKNNRIKGYAYCLRHYNLSLLKNNNKLGL